VLEQRVLIFPPSRRDGEAARELLQRAHIEAAVCRDVANLAAQIKRGAGALVLTDATLGAPNVDVVFAALAAQPPWSDLPLVLLCAPETQRVLLPPRLLCSLTNVTLLDRPASARSLLSAIQAALRARLRQYQIRDQLEALQSAEESLRTRERELRASDRRKDEFLAMLAHELRNPLAPIRSASELLTRLVPEHSPVQAPADILQRQITHLTRIVDDLLDVSRITQDRIELQKKPLEVRAVIADALESAGPLMREKGHRLEVCSSEARLYVEGDGARLVQCVANLLVNAAKYTDPGGEIRVAAYAEDATAVIAVSDNGVGVPPELLPQIFDLFVQSRRSLDRAQGGLGIGLSLVRRLIQMHGGQVTAASEGAGRGARFEIRLPLIAAPTASAQPPSAQRVSPKRILVVDDNQDAADSLAMVLKMNGHEAHAVYSPEDALEHLGAHASQVVLLDIGLPRMDGYQVAQQVRRSGLPVRMIALTGYGQLEDVKRATAAGFDAHLIKPVDFDLLERALAHSDAAPAEGALANGKPLIHDVR
jgi:two-component system, sensor histidine kinase